jgi:uncharacterized protein involved in exopolysaccharide biosynthesis
MSEHTLRSARNDRATEMSLREVLVPLFRRRRLFTFTFCGILLGAILVAVALPKKYDAHMKILLKREERVDPVITTDATIQMPTTAVTPEEINDEVELLKSRDLLEKVALASGLPKKKNSWLSMLAQPKQAKEEQISEAVDQLSKKLRVESLTRTNLIEVTYQSPDPQLSYRVLNTLANLYTEKHLAVHRPPGAFDFFQLQTDQYRRGLAEAEARLASFGEKESVVVAQTERDLVVQKLVEFEGALHQTEAGTAETQRRIDDLEAQLRVTPPRLNTTLKAADNGATLEVMESTLSTLQLKRTDMTAHFLPNYRPLKDIDAQIAEARAQIAQVKSAPLHEDTTDVNPPYRWLTDELVKCRADLATLKARTAATTQNVHLYRQMALDLGNKQLQQQDLIRDAKLAEGNFLLYVNKREEARISDALDSKRIVNVAIAEAATVPAHPTQSSWLLLMLGALAACTVSTGAAFISDYIDPSLRTAEEVQHVLQISVLAALPKRRVG